MTEGNKNKGNRLKVGLIFGGRSGEHEVSLMSARSVMKALSPQKYEVIQIGITRTGKWLVGERLLDLMSDGDESQIESTARICTLLPFPGSGLYTFLPGEETRIELLSSLDVVFPVLHGTFGEDGTLQGFLELADLAYVGAGVLGSAVGMDKGLFKDMMRAHGIPVVDWILTTRMEIESQPDTLIERVELAFEYPVYIKPANLGSSVGISLCRSRADLHEGLLYAAMYDRRVLIEKGLEAREIEVSVLGNERPEVSMPGEILPSREYYSYEAKYLDGTSGLIIPAPLPKETTQLVRELALKAYQLIDCAGMARVDFLLDKDAPINGQVDGLYLNEVNTIPGFTGISMYPKLWEASGLPYAQLIDRLIELALERKSERDQTVREYDRGRQS